MAGRISRRTLLAAGGAGAAGRLVRPAAAGASAEAPRAAKQVEAGTAGDWDVMSDTWVATDGLGRDLPTYDEVGPPRADRFVGLFYFLWLGFVTPDGPYDVSKILHDNPDAMTQPDNPAWGPPEHPHYWSEPYFGYYQSTDKWVIRRHARMLADAGVDAVFFDVTNQVTYPECYHALLDAFAEVRQAGGTTPQIGFLTPFWDPQQVTKTLYQDLYQPGTHSDLWFRWKGKPLILADPDLLGLDSLTGDGSDPAELSAGHTQGQTFQSASAFTRVTGRIPTWETTDSAMTLTLRAGGPEGAVVASKAFTDVVDNGKPMLELDPPAPACGYYLEQSAPVGSIGWWTDPAGAYADGSAYVDGVAVAGDRSIYLQSADGITGEILDFFTFRKPQPSYFTGPDAPDQWGWLEVSPQHVFRDDAGNPEQMTVGVAQNTVDGRLGSMSENDSLGRSYHDGTLPVDHSQTPYGLNVQQQWDRALDVDPEFVFVTGWNEWIAGRFSSFGGVDLPVMFVDEFDWEHSRDIEPCRGGTDRGFPEGNAVQDAYYYQLVSNIRWFKGARPLPVATSPVTIHVPGEFGQWADVGPEYRDHAGDTDHRDALGWGDHGHYVETSGRNDIVAAKVARDARNVYFYARTAAPLSDPSEPNWMLLFIDVTGDPATGWEGFDFVVNRTVTGSRRTSVECSAAGWAWSPVGQVRYAAAGSELQLVIPRHLLGVATDAPVRLDFKWIDNMQRDGDLLDLIQSGDTAPSGRFRYRYLG